MGDTKDIGIGRSILDSSEPFPKCACGWLLPDRIEACVDVNVPGQHEREPTGTVTVRFHCPQCGFGPYVLTSGGRIQWMR